MLNCSDLIESTGLKETLESQWEQENRTIKTKFLVTVVDLLLELQYGLLNLQSTGT